MTNLWPRTAIVCVLAVTVSAPLVARRWVDHAAGEDEQTNATQASHGRLVVLTPHNDQIRYEFATAFNRHRIALRRPPVEFDWRSPGGTSDLRKQVISQFTKLAQSRREPEGIGVDLFFGGGPFEHDLLARGLVVERDRRMVHIPLTAPINLPRQQIKACFPDADIGGQPLYRVDADGGPIRWVGTAVSSFGIVWNRQVVAMLGLNEPRGWSDLCQPVYQNWIALADPAHSGSVAATYNTILQTNGWSTGWLILRRVFANAQYFSSSASKVPLDVSAGEAAAGMCIDFYGRYQAGQVPKGRVGYRDPVRQSSSTGETNLGLETAVTADPISILVGAPSPKLALAFVTFVLSTEGQGLWQRRLGTEGGPAKYELRRMPVVRSMYRPDEMKHWHDPVNPFNLARPLPKGMPSFYKAVAPVTHAMAIDIHGDLRAAWSTLQRSGVDRPNARQKKMLELFDAMPTGTDNRGEDFSLAIRWPEGVQERDVTSILNDPSHPRHGQLIETLQAFANRLTRRYTIKGSQRSWNDQDKLLRHRLAWTTFFRKNYRAIVELADSES